MLPVVCVCSRLARLKTSQERVSHFSHVSGPQARLAFNTRLGSTTCPSACRTGLMVVVCRLPRVSFAHYLNKDGSESSQMKYLTSPRAFDLPSLLDNSRSTSPFTRCFPYPCPDSVDRTGRGSMIYILHNVLYDLGTTAPALPSQRHPAS